MKNLLWSGFFIVLVLSGCSNGTPTRLNTFTPLTSIEITAVSSTIAAQTSTRLTATGNYSGLFTRDITAQVVWSSDTPNVAGTFTTAATPNRAWVTAGSAGHRQPDRNPGKRVGYHLPTDGNFGDNPDHDGLPCQSNDPQGHKPAIYRKRRLLGRNYPRI